MKQYLLILLGCIVGMTSCVSVATVEEFSVESLLPADITFAPTVKTIAVIDNTEPASIPALNGVTVKTTLQADGSIVAEKLATSIADANYFDKVVISSTSAGNDNPKTRVLHPDTVKNILEELGADMLLTVDKAKIKTRSMYTDYRDELPYVSGAVTVQTRLYMPGRVKPFQNFVDRDTLYWPLVELTDKIVITEASEYMGDIAMKHVSPYWNEEGRYYFSGGSINMRDAAVSMRENDWDLAFDSWMLDYKGKSKKKKMRAAYNIGLYYEMKGDMQTAIKYVQEARDMAVGNARPKQDSTLMRLPEEWIFIDRYLNTLQQKELLLQKLNLQLERFNE